MTRDLGHKSRVIYIYSMGRRKTTEQFIAEARAIHGDKYDYSNTKYEGSKVKLTITCRKHGDFQQWPEGHLHGNGCPKCKFEKQGVERKLSTEEFIKRSKEIHGDRYDYSKSIYTGWYNKVEIICKEHGSFLQNAGDHLCAEGCQVCGEKTKIVNKITPKSEILKRFKEINQDKYEYDLTDYNGCSSKIKIYCNTHNIWFAQTVQSHLVGSGCPKCKNTKTQYKIYEFLIDSFPEETWYWEHSPSWLGLQRFDIYNKRCNFAIEYNGIQHYQPIEYFGGEDTFKMCTNYDSLKKQKCLDNNCELYIIKYDDVDYEKIKQDITELLKRENI